ncbi:hypothetical protein [Streptomyces sp. B21-083]
MLGSTPERTYGDASSAGCARQRAHRTLRAGTSVIGWASAAQPGRSSG